MEKTEKQAILTTRHRMKTYKTLHSLFCMSSFCALLPILPVSLDSPFFVLYVFILCLVANIACVSGFSILCFVCLRSVPCAQYCLCLWILHSLLHKTQNEDIQNKEWRIQRHRQY
jgi:hypothetical protein